MTRTRFLRTVAALSSCAALGLGSITTAGAACLEPPGDINNDGVTTVLDVQCSVLANLWSLAGQVGQVPDCIKVPGSPAIVADHNCDGVINVADTILAIQFTLNIPLSPAIDANGNQCVDACETDLDGDGTFDVLDCAPHDPTIHANALEICNGYDDNCNSIIDGAGASVIESCSNDDVCDGIETCQDTPTDLGIVITEIMHSPAAVSDANGEWFEIFNAGTVAVNIQGWTITDEAGETHVIDPGGALFVAPRGYLVLARNNNISTNGGIRVGYQYSGITLNGTVDTIALLDKNLGLRDRVAWNASWPAASGASLALKDVRLDNNVAANWMVSTQQLAVVGDPSTPWGPNRDAMPGFCQDGTPLACDDGNDCTDDACDAQDGCFATPNSLPCDDGEICTTNDTCVDGQCVGGPPPNCDDANPCTDDTCENGVGCVNTPNTAPCDDGDACTTDDTCAGGSCVGGPAPDCDDGDICTDNDCDPATGCTTANNTAPCDDGDACTTNDTCAGGQCVGGPALNCDDGNVCTDDGCDPASGCTNVNNTAPCDDGDACTTDDACAGGVCVGGPALVCDDGNLCTADSCNPATGCVSTPIELSCEDDGDPCTENVCNPATGTCGVAAPDGTSCDDGEQCTVPDLCQAGVCQSDDFEPCFDGTSNVLCVISGASGAEVRCPIRVAAAPSTALGTTLQLSIEYPAALSLAYFTDGNQCFGAGGGPPCVPNILTGASGQSQLLSGHQLFAFQNTVSNWETGGALLLIDLSDPGNPLTEATYADGAVLGNAVIMEGVFVLEQDVPADSPIYVSSPAQEIDNVVVTDDQAMELPTSVFGALIITGQGE